MCGHVCMRDCGRYIPHQRTMNEASMFTETPIKAYEAFKKKFYFKTLELKSGSTYLKINQILNYVKELMYNEVDLGSVMCVRHQKTQQGLT